MAQKVTVLDLGSWSLKRVDLRVPLVGLAVSGAKEVGNSSALEAKNRRAEQLKGLRELLPRHRLSGDAVTLVMPAEKPLNRFVEMPFSQRSKIDSVLAFELENYVPFQANQFVHDYIVMQKRKNGATLFVSLVPRREMEEHEELFATFNLDPRVVIHQAVASARLAELCSSPVARRAAFIDMGHRKTVVTIVENGRFAGCRVIVQGGYDLTRALAERFGMSAEEAEAEKHSLHLYPAGDGLAVGHKQEAADCLLEALAPLVRDLRQTFKGMGAVDEVYLFGGGAKLGGVDSFLSSALGRPVALLHPSMLKVPSSLDGNELQYVSAIAAGFAGYRGSDAQRINFRQGEFAYEGDFKFLRGRLLYLAVVLTCLMAAFATPQALRYKAATQQELRLRDTVAALSEKILGERTDDWDEVLGRLEQMPSAEVWTVFPDLSAYEVYWEVADIIARIDGTPTGEAPRPEDGATPGPDQEKASSAQTPGTAPDGEPGSGIARGPLTPNEGGENAGDRGSEASDNLHHLDMNQIRIDSSTRTAAGDGVVEFTGNASSVATMELFLSKIGQHPCFRNVQRTKQEMLKATPGKEGWWRFTVEFTVSCPKKALQELKKGEEERGGELGGEGSNQTGKREETGMTREKQKGGASKKEDLGQKAERNDEEAQRGSNTGRKERKDRKNSRGEKKEEKEEGKSETQGSAPAAGRTGVGMESVRPRRLEGEPSGPASNTPPGPNFHSIGRDLRNIRPFERVLPSSVPEQQVQPWRGE